MRNPRSRRSIKKRRGDHRSAEEMLRGMLGLRPSANAERLQFGGESGIQMTLHLRAFSGGTGLGGVALSRHEGIMRKKGMRSFTVTGPCQVVRDGQWTGFE